MNKNYLVMLFLFLAAVAQVFAGGPTPSQVLDTANIADGSVTAAKIETGYNLLTDAEKTQALTGSSTVDFVCKNISTFNQKTYGQSLGSIAATTGIATFTEIGSVLGGAISGIVCVYNASSGTGATLSLSQGALTFISGGAITVTKGTANRINVYVTAGGAIEVENTIASPRTVYISFIGLDMR